MAGEGDRFSNTAPGGRRDTWFLKEPPDKPLVMRDIDAPAAECAALLAAMRKLWDEMDDEEKADVGEELARQLFGQDEETP